MKTIKLQTADWEKDFNFDIGDKLLVKDFAIIYPILKEHSNNEIKMVIEMCKWLSPDDDMEEKVGNLDMEQFEILSKFITWLIDQKKKLSKKPEKESNQ